MLFGPVFARELMTTARRPRTYTTRVIGGIILLALLGVHYYALWLWQDAIPGDLPLSWVRYFTETLFYSIMLVMSLPAVAVHVEAMAAAISGEKQRKTLHYMLASRLSSLEIITDKVAARMLHVVQGLAVGFPVAMLLVPMGGVDPRLIGLAYAAVLSVSFFVASISTLCAVLSSRAREAAGFAAVLIVAWTALPMLVFYLVVPALNRYLPASWWLVPITVSELSQWLLASNPAHFVSFSGIMTLVSRGPGSQVDAVVRMIELQCAGGVILLLLSAWQLRPAFRRQEERAGSKERKLSLKRVKRRRPACGDDAMIWKERFAQRPQRGIARAVGRCVVFLLLVGLGVLTWQWAWPALLESLQDPGNRIAYAARADFNTYLRVLTAVLCTVWAAAVAGDAATRVPTEKDQDTWLSLLSTPLSGVNILRAKMLGAVWSQRVTGFTLLALWGLGVATGAVSARAIVLVLFELAVVTWFFVSLGTFLSLSAESTNRAHSSGAGLSTLSCIVGPLCAGAVQVYDQARSPTIFWLTGNAPGLLTISLLSWRDIQTYLKGPDVWTAPIFGTGQDINSFAFDGARHGEGLARVLAWGVGTLLIFGASAAVLTWLSFRRFDKAVGRPRRANVGENAPVPETRASAGSLPAVLASESL